MSTQALRRKYRNSYRGYLIDHHSPDPPGVFIAEIAAIAAQGVRPFLFSGSPKPEGSLDKLEFDEITAAYREIECQSSVTAVRLSAVTVHTIVSVEG